MVVSENGYSWLPLLFPTKRETIKAIANRKKRILAMEAAPEAMTPKPNTPAIMAMMNKVIDQRNMSRKFKS